MSCGLHRPDRLFGIVAHTTPSSNNLSRKSTQTLTGSSHRVTSVPVGSGHRSKIRTRFHTTLLLKM